MCCGGVSIKESSVRDVHDKGCFFEYLVPLCLVFHGRLVQCRLLYIAGVEGNLMTSVGGMEGTAGVEAETE